MLWLWKVSFVNDRCFLNDDPLPAEHAFLSSNDCIWDICLNIFQHLLEAYNANILISLDLLQVRRKPEFKQTTHNVRLHQPPNLTRLTPRKTLVAIPGLLFLIGFICRWSEFFGRNLLCASWKRLETQQAPSNLCFFMKSWATSTHPVPL